MRLERRGSVALLTLDRPDALNALDRATLEALRAHCGALASDRELRAVVVTGAGRAFAAGADIAEMSRCDPRQAEALSRLGHEAFAALESLPVPVIAAVNGFALGGGCELACACDWIYASKKARFGQPEVGLGLIPGFAGTTRLARRVGHAWAMEIILTGETLDADTALRIGLANRTYEPDALHDAALAAAESIARKGPLSVAAAKRAIREAPGTLEQSAFGALFGTEDAREGLTAFLEKRDARFSGR